MLIAQFSLGVELESEDKIRSILMDDYGVEIRKVSIYTEKLCFNEVKTRKYFECFVPYNRMKALLDRLDGIDENVILTY